MNEQDVLTFLIVFALFINCLGFLFFGLSLKTKPNVEYEERYKEHKRKKIKKDKFDDHPNEEVDEPYAFKTLSRDYEEPKVPIEDEEELPYRFNTMDGQDRFTDSYDSERILKEESFRMFDDEDDGIPLKRIDEGDPRQFSYEPVYEEEPQEHVETLHVDEYEPSPYQFTYESENAGSTEPDEQGDDEPLKMVDDGNRTSEPVDYMDEIESASKSEDLTHRYDGEYRFKHAYTKDERYKYEYEDIKGLEEKSSEHNQLEKEIEDDFDYDYDVDKEHEKFYGSEEEVTRLSHAATKDKERNMFQQTNLLEDIPATPLDLSDEDDQLETFDIKQFEPLKYKDKMGLVEDEENFDDEEVDRRIEYLMGKMNDPFKKEKEKDPMEEEF